MRLRDLIEKTLARMNPGEYISHQEGDVVFQIMKHRGIHGGNYYSYWENGSCLRDDLMLHEAVIKLVK